MLAFLRGAVIEETVNYHRDLEPQVVGRLEPFRTASTSRGRMVVEIKTRRAGQALMTETTRFETPIIQRDAFDAPPRDRRVARQKLAIGLAPGLMRV